MLVCPLLKSLLLALVMPAFACSSRDLDYLSREYGSAPKTSQLEESGTVGPDGSDGIVEEASVGLGPETRQDASVEQDVGTTEPSDGGGDACVASADKTDAGSTAFCVEFCNKCDECYKEGRGFFEGDCQRGSSTFDRRHCLTTCPELTDRNECTMPPMWQTASCFEFDNAT